mgnify:CR=1 FL=1
MDTNEELNARLLSLIDWIGQTGKELESGIREQAPELAREIIAYQKWESSVAIIAGIVLFFVGCKAFAWGIRKFDETPACIPAIFLGAISSTVGAAFVCTNIQPLIKVSVAPRVYLVETASKWLHK